MTAPSSPVSVIVAVPSKGSSSVPISNAPSTATKSDVIDTSTSSPSRVRSVPFTARPFSRAVCVSSVTVRPSSIST